MIKIYPTSFTKCEVDGAPCVMAFTSGESHIIDSTSPYYLHAITSLIVLEKCSEKPKKNNVIPFKPEIVVNNATP